MKRVLFLVFLCATPAWAHSWYPIECCAGNDCALLDESRVHTAPGGYLVDDRFFVEQAQVRQSPDGAYHACFPTKDYLQCFFAPPPGS